ncbi:MAG: DUF4097 family beta strand repeat-containing protein [Gemmatimonadaceae bacterium]
MLTRLCLVAAITAAAVPLGAQGRVERGLPLASDGAVRIYNTVGSVRVTGWSRDSIVVRGTLGQGNFLHFGGTRSAVKMFVEGRDERNPAPAAIEVMVPHRSKVWVKTASASIEVSGVAGSLDLYVVGGRITVNGNPADLNAEAIDGPIRIVGNPGWVRARSASGDVTLDGSSVDVTLSTVSGKIDADGSGYEKAKFESVTGSIRFAGGFRPGGSVTFDTHSGTIEVGLSSSGRADFDIVSIAGPITNRLTSTRPVKGRYGRGSELNTSSNGGGTRVAIRSFKGPVSLIKLD